MQERGRGMSMNWKKWKKKKKRSVTGNNAVHRCQTAQQAWLETMFARLTSLFKLIFILPEFLHGVTVFCWCILLLLQLWQYHPQPYLAETTSPGKANTPCWASRLSSLPCPLNKQLSLRRLCGRERDTRDYRLAPSQLCCFTPSWTRPC